jgi:beta-lactamase regulating signal transducer with metallopeptidase domain
MVQFVEWAVANSLAVLLLAPVVWGLGRVCPWPSVRHTLWLVLLLKLVTPPLVTVPVDVLVADLLRPAPAIDTTAPSAMSVPVVERSQPAHVSAEPAAPLPIASGAANPRPISAAPVAIVDVPAAAPVARQDEATAPPSVTTAIALPALSAETGRVVLRVLLGVWLVGTIVFFAAQTVRLLRFGRNLGRFSLRCEQLDEETAAIAERLGLKHYPQPRLVDGVVSPMLWGAGRWTRVLFPAELFEQLDAEARGTLLMHELAHYRRGDHWVRVLEFAVTTVFWWHPVVWWALREIESAEEDCCDSWVMQRSASTPRCYATALLDTIDFLCERHPAAPPVSSGLGNPTELRGRLVRIMTGTAQATLSPFGRAIVWSLVVVLPVQPAAFAELSKSFRGLIVIAPDERLLAEETSLTANEVASTAGSARLPTLPISPSPLDGVGASPSAYQRAKEWARAGSADGRFQIVARTGRHVELQDLRRSRTTDLTAWNIASAAFVPGTTTFITGGFDRQVRLWDAASGRLVRTLGEHTDAVVSVAVSGDGSTLATASRDGLLSRWSLIGQAVRDDLSLGSPINSVRFSPRGSEIAVGAGSWRSGESGGLIVVHVASWTVLDQTSMPAPIGVVAYTDDDLVLAAAAWDGTVHYLGGGDLAPLLSVVSSKDAVSAGAFSADTRVFPTQSLEEARAQLARERQQQAEAPAVLGDGQQFLPAGLSAPPQVRLPAPAR